MFYSAQRLNDLGDESRLLPLWRQVFISFCFSTSLLVLEIFYFIFKNGADAMVESPLHTFFSILFLSDTPDGYANVISELIFSAVFGLPYCSTYATKLLITGRASIPMEQLYVRSAYR